MTLAKICKRFYWHNYMEQVCLVIKTFKEFQLIKWIGSARYYVEDFKSIPICGLSYMVAFDVVGPLPKRILKGTKVINTF
jgi:hypothetical protein